MITQINQFVKGIFKQQQPTFTITSIQCTPVRDTVYEVYRRFYERHGFEFSEEEVMNIIS